MTENLLQKLEERTMTILSELETLRSEVKSLRQENFLLRSEKENNAGKLKDLLSLLETIPSTSHTSSESQLFEEEAASAA